MHTYSCGNCGGGLSGPNVTRCPHCSARLGGVEEVTEMELRRRQGERKRSSPEAIRRRQNIQFEIEKIGAVVGSVILGVFIVTLLVGGGAALGWFILARHFGQDAALPLAVGGGVLGAILTHSLYRIASNQTFFTHAPFLASHSGGESEWLRNRREEIEAKERGHIRRVAIFRFLAACGMVPLAGYLGWQTIAGAYQTLGTIAGILVGAGLAIRWVNQWGAKNAPPRWSEVQDQEKIVGRMQQVVTDQEKLKRLTHALAHPEEISRLPADLRELAQEMRSQSGETAPPEKPARKPRKTNPKSDSTPRKTREK